jgi:AcrR family transcriptional regulator
MLRTTDLDALSLRKLAAVLGVTAPALYAHVEDKQDLLRAVAERGFTDLVARFRAVEVDDLVERLRAYGQAYVDLALAEPEVFRVMFLFRPGALDVPGVDNELAAASEAFAVSGEAVATAIEVGALHPDRDPLLTALTLWTTAHGCASVLLLGASGGEVIVPEGLGQLVDQVIDTTLLGLRQPPGAAAAADAAGADAAGADGAGADRAGRADRAQPAGRA